MMNEVRLGSRLGLAILVILLGGAAMALDRVTGTATYRERLVMPPTAVFEAPVEDVTRVNAPSVVIGTIRIENAGNPPHAFSMDIDPATIDDRATFALSAHVQLDGQLMFIRNTMVPVLTRGASWNADIVMVRAPSQAEVLPLPAHGLVLPASFKGDLPCADCEAIRHHLDLWSYQAFHLRREWIGGIEPLIEDRTGHWSVDASRNALQLWIGADAPLEFAITNAGALRLLDVQGHPIVSDLPYELTSLGRLDPTPVADAFIGEFIYFADSAIFTDCRTGLKFPVAMEGDYLSLERAYLETRSEPMAPIVTVIEGEITMREGMEGGLRQTVTVKRFDGIWPGLTCDRARTDASFERTYWLIDALDGESLAAIDGLREPNVVFSDVDGGRFSATVGCNMINGGFELGGDGGLTLSAGAMSMMACPPPIDAWEHQLVDVFGRTASKRIVGPTMVFQDADGAVIARLEAVWVLVRDQYDDGGISGGTLERPGLKRLLEDIEDGLVDIVCTYKIDRLSRSLADFAKLVEVFDRNGVTFVSVTQSFNTTTSMGRLTLNILLSFAQFEREVTAERICDKVAASRRKGMWMGGVPPFGYRVENRKLVVDEDRRGWA